jgi:hypothetical protein
VMQVRNFSCCASTSISLDESSQLLTCCGEERND